MSVIEECGRVVALETRGAWIETLSRSGCGRCDEPGGCGQASITRLFGNRVHHILASYEQELRIGDRVVIGVPENLLLRASLVVYLIPLAGLLAGAIAGNAYAAGAESGAIAGAGCGVALGLLVARLVSARLARNGHWQPRVLRQIPLAGVQSWPAQQR